MKRIKPIPLLIALLLFWNAVLTTRLFLLERNPAVSFANAWVESDENEQASTDFVEESYSKFQKEKSFHSIDTDLGFVKIPHLKSGIGNYQGKDYFLVSATLSNTSEQDLILRKPIAIYQGKEIFWVESDFGKNQLVNLFTIPANTSKNCLLVFESLESPNEFSITFFDRKLPTHIKHSVTLIPQFVGEMTKEDLAG